LRPVDLTSYRLNKKRSYKASESNINSNVFDLTKQSTILPTLTNSKAEASIINMEADIKISLPKRNNKNDFYRFLLAQNYNN
jgi:hypothetical protein